METEEAKRRTIKTDNQSKGEEMTKEHAHARPQRGRRLDKREVWVTVRWTNNNDPNWVRMLDQ